MVEIPRNCIDFRTGPRYRSIVAALIACNSVIASGVADGESRSPASRSNGSHIGNMTTRYFPHGKPINAHTRFNSNRASSLYPFGRFRRRSTCSAGSGRRGPVSIRRAVDRPIPVVAVTSSRIRPRSALDALRYALRSLFVTCRLVAIGILPSTSGKPHPEQGATRSKNLRHQPHPSAQTS